VSRPEGNPLTLQKDITLDRLPSSCIRLYITQVVSKVKIFKSLLGEII